MILSAKQMRDALKFCNPDEEDKEQLETEVVFFYLNKETISTYGDLLPCGVYCYLEEYPDEGIYGPLGVDIIAGEI